MVSTTTFGDFPGVQVTTAGGAITGVAVGREQKLLVVGIDDVGDGSASINEPTQVAAPTSQNFDSTFGTESELSEALKDASANGANNDFLYGVVAEQISVSAENFTSTSFTLANTPIVEDLSTITITNNGTGSDPTPEFRYESPPPAPSDSDTAFINPQTGEVEINSGDADFDVAYDYVDWATALDAAETVIDQEESAVIAALTESESVATTLSGNVNSLRGDYKMALGVTAAQPNASASGSEPILDENDAKIDASTYTDSIDNDAYFLHAPARKEDSIELITGAFGGLMAGNALDNSIYSDNLTTNNLDQRLSSSDASDLRDSEVIPVRQPRSGGSIEVSGNLSTSTETDYNRSYFVRRIVDQAILIAKSIGDAVIGRINDQDTRDTVENQINVELRGLAGDGLIEPNTEDELNWDVTVYEIDNETIGIDMTITPFGIAKDIDVSLTIDA
jgi:hypothetical protein